MSKFAQNICLSLSKSAKILPKNVKKNLTRMQENFAQILQKLTELLSKNCVCTDSKKQEKEKCPKSTFSPRILVISKKKVFAQYQLHFFQRIQLIARNKKGLHFSHSKHMRSRAEHFSKPKQDTIVLSQQWIVAQFCTQFAQILKIYQYLPFVVQKKGLQICPTSFCTVVGMLVRIYTCIL